MKIGDMNKKEYDEKIGNVIELLDRIREPLDASHYYANECLTKILETGGDGLEIKQLIAGINSVITVSERDFKPKINDILNAIEELKEAKQKLELIKQ